MGGQWYNRGKLLEEVRSMELAAEERGLLGLLTYSSHYAMIASKRLVGPLSSSPYGHQKGIVSG